jgi:hypothetical protein
LGEYAEIRWQVRGKEESAFSEVKEAKRLCSFGVE